LRVLVVEDVASLAEIVAEGLRDAGMAVDLALDGIEAVMKVAGSGSVGLRGRVRQRPGSGGCARDDDPAGGQGRVLGRPRSGG
jgi:CheY-like chemotaxis protein